MRKAHCVTLTPEERSGLLDLISAGRESARTPKPRRLDGRQEAHLIALACGAPPAGKQRWSLRLLADRFVALEAGAAVSYQVVRRTLKKTSSSRGCGSSGASHRTRAG